MSDTTTSGSTPSEAPAATAGAPDALAADWGAASGVRGSGLARGKRVSPPATPAPVSNTSATGTYKPSAVQILKAETEYQNPFAPVNETPSAPAPEPAPAPVVEAPVAQAVVPPAEAPAPASVAPVAPPAQPAEPAPKAELNILPPAELKRPAQSWETPAFPYEAEASAAKAGKPESPAARVESPLRSERPVFRPERRSDVPMLEPAPNAGGSPRGNNPRGHGQRHSRGGNRPQQPRDQKRPGGNTPAPAKASHQPRPAPAGGQPAKKAGGLFGWVKGLFGATEAPEPSLPGAKPLPAQDGERPAGTRRRRRRGGRGRSGGLQPGPNGQQGANSAQSHGQGHPAHGHGGGEHRPQGQGGRRRRGGRGRSGGHRHDGGGSGIPPSA